MKKIWISLLILLACVSLAVLGATAYVHWAGRQPVAKGTEYFVITPGTGLKSLAQELVEEGVLEEPFTFIVWTYAKDYTRRIRAGEYEIEEGVTIEQLLDKFESGKVIDRSITVVEGWSFKEMRSALEATEKLKQVAAEFSDERLMQELGAQGLAPEGRFFPDTYQYTAGMSDLDILKAAYALMDNTLNEEWESRDPNTRIESKDEALILASIIEKETGDPSERSMISGVFHNRLARNMRLQTDPTVIYGLGDNFDGNLTRKHLRTDTPYNTYTRNGLPPTPIALPGRAAIHAALNPESTDALYFVSRGDGTHKFSETLEAHNQAVAEYQLKKRPKQEQ